jgi:aspartyl/asparaginyl beta-hydroxylase (cupin superfamily)
MSGGVRDRALGLANEAGASALHRLERIAIRSSKVPTTPFLPLSTFGWIPELEAHTAEMRDELDSVLEHRAYLPNFQDISVDQASITNDDGWKTFFFFGYGFRADANCRRCPKTAALVEAIPDMKTAFFSILGPHKHIGEHRGPWRGVLRYHLALRVPEPSSACGIAVGGQLRRWHEGRSLLFDDGYDHFAWNDTGEIRVVLFVDVLRPLRSPADQLNRSLIKAISWSPYIRDARARHEAWQERFDIMTGTA